MALNLENEHRFYLSFHHANSPQQLRITVDSVRAEPNVGLLLLGGNSQ